MLIQPRSPDVLVFPASGITGQTLTKSGSLDNVVAWQTTAGGIPAHFPMLSGLWYSNAFRDYSSATFTVSTNVSYYVPFWLDAPISVSGVGVYVSSQSATAVCNWAFYNASATTGMPSTVIAKSTSATDGAIPVTAGGATSVTTLFDLPSGWVWAAISATTANYAISGIATNYTGVTGYLSAVRWPVGIASFDRTGIPFYYQRASAVFTDAPALSAVYDTSPLPKISFKVA